MNVMPFHSSFSLLTPLLWGAAMLFFLLAGRIMLQSWLEHRQRDMEQIEWGAPPPRLLQRWRTKMSRIRLRLSGFAKQRIPEIVPKPKPPVPATPIAEPVKKPPQAALPLFGSTIGAPSDKPKDGFVWEQTKEIE
jgi:hypothetical protein